MDPPAPPNPTRTPTPTTPMRALAQPPMRLPLTQNNLSNIVPADSPSQSTPKKQPAAPGSPTRSALPRKPSRLGLRSPSPAEDAAVAGAALDTALKSPPRPTWTTEFVAPSPLQRRTKPSFPPPPPVPASHRLKLKTKRSIEPTTNGDVGTPLPRKIQPANPMRDTLLSRVRSFNEQLSLVEDQLEHLPLDDPFRSSIGTASVGTASIMSSDDGSVAESRDDLQQSSYFKMLIARINSLESRILAQNQNQSRSQNQNQNQNQSQNQGNDVKESPKDSPDAGQTNDIPQTVHDECEIKYAALVRQLETANDKCKSLEESLSREQERAQKLMHYNDELLRENQLLKAEVREIIERVQHGGQIYILSEKDL